MSLESVLQEMRNKFGDQQSMPFVQYVNRRGWFMPLAQAEALADSLDIDVPEIGDLTSVFLGDNDVPGFLTKTLTIAPIATRYRWDTEKNRGRRQVYAFVKAKVGEEVRFVGPVTITASGLPSGELGKALKEHRSKLGSLRLSQVVPLHLGMGPAVPTGHGSTKRTPVVWEIGDPKEEYVGDETARRIIELIPEAQTWREQWKKQEKKEKTSEPAEQTAPEAAAPVPEMAAADIPF